MEKHQYPVQSTLASSVDSKAQPGSPGSGKESLQASGTEIPDEKAASMRSTNEDAFDMLVEADNDL